MALTLSRWIALALIACLLVPVLVFRDREEYWSPVTQRDILARRADLAWSHVRTAGERYRISRVADSVRRTVPASPAAPGTVAYDRAFTAENRALLEDLTADALSDRVAAPLVNVDIRFVMDTVTEVSRSLRRGFGGAMAIDYVLPVKDADRCLVIARIQPRLRAEFQSDISRERLLGPCGFYQAFGRPGPAVEKWLRDGGWQLAQIARWEGEIRRWRGTNWIEVEKYPLRYMIGSRGYRCATGSDSMCVAAVLDPRMRAFKVGGGIISTADHNPFSQSSYWYAREWSFGQRASSFLADMVRSVGDERFAKFWRSDVEVPAAFAAATGSDLASWTRDWLTRVYHAEKPGPTISAAELLWGLVALGLAGALSLRMAQRRQII